MELKRRALVLAVVLLALALFATWLWQPERQVRLHQRDFLKAVERRNWNAARDFLADNYSDRWGHDKTFLLDAAHDVFAAFLALSVQSRGDALERTGSIATLHATIKIAGTGHEIAQVVMSKVNTLQEPFTFTWTQRSAKPWDWQLVRIDQAELELSDAPGF